MTLDQMRRVHNNWDSYGAPAPNRVAIQAAQRVLDALQHAGLKPDRIVPSAEGGVGIVFFRGDRYADFECFNDGGVLIGMSDRTGNPIVREVRPDQPIGPEIERVRRFIR